MSGAFLILLSSFPYPALRISVYALQCGRLVGWHPRPRPHWALGDHASAGNFFLLQPSRRFSSFLHSAFRTNRYAACAVVSRSPTIAPAAPGVARTGSFSLQSFWPMCRCSIGSSEILFGSMLRQMRYSAGAFFCARQHGKSSRPSPPGSGPMGFVSSHGERTSEFVESRL